MKTEVNNQIKFTKEQLQIAINQHINEEKGIKELFQMVINGLMHGERTSYLSESGKGNKGNGYREITKAGFGTGLTLQIPRDRLGLFKPVILGVLEQQEEKIKDLSFALYGKGLTTRQISEVLTDIYGTSYSKSGISRITSEFSEVVNSWLTRPLEEHYPVIFIDAIYVKVRRDVVATEAFYIVLGLKEDLTREVLAIANNPTESASGWTDILMGLKSRGLKSANLFVFDNLTELNQSVGKCFPKAKQQLCTLHFQRNLSKKIRVKDREAFCNEIKSVFNPDDKSYNPTQAVEALKDCLRKWSKVYPALNSTIENDNLPLLFTYLNYDYRVRRMIYTTNWIERLNKSFKRTLKIRNALPTIDSVITLLGYVAMETGNKVYSYPVTLFKFEKEFCKS